MTKLELFYDETTTIELIIIALLLITVTFMIFRGFKAITAKLTEYAEFDDEEDDDYTNNSGIDFV